MGKAIEAIARQRGHQIVGKLDPGSGLSFDFSTPVDVAIEFTQPESAAANIRTCIDRRIPVLSGTTGWLDQKPSIDAHCIQQHGTFFYASNYSLGVNIFFELSKHLAKMMQSRPYDVHMEEIHHTQKKDAPSGTAISIAEQILENMSRKKHWAKESTDNPDAFPIIAHRIENVPGTHVVKYSSEIDDIEILHTAHNRKGFALGAVLAAEYINGKEGIFDMRDVLGIKKLED